MPTTTLAADRSASRCAQPTANKPASLSLLIVLAGGWMVYVQNVPVFVGYGLGLLGLLGVLFTARRPGGMAGGLVSICLVLFAAASLMSVVSVALATDNLHNTLLDNLQHLLYPVTASIALLCFGDFRSRSNQRALFWFAAIAGVGNGALALVNSVCGPFTLPLVGPLEHGRYIFLTSIGSSGGLFDSVNYYSTSQVMLFWLAMGTRRCSGLSGGGALAICGAILASSIVGSSRGALLAAAASGCLYWIVARPFQGSRLLMAVFACLVTTLAVLYVDIESETVSQGFRMKRGLNSREVIWEVAWDVFRDYPLLGVGGAFGEELQNRGCPMNAAQNVLVASLLRGGILGTLPWLAAAVLCFLCAVQNSRTAWAAAAIAAWAIDGMARTYSLGGLGLVPVIAALAMSWVLWDGRGTRPAVQRGKQYIPSYVGRPRLASVARGLS